MHFGLTFPRFGRFRRLRRLRRLRGFVCFSELFNGVLRRICLRPLQLAGSLALVRRRSLRLHVRE